MESREEEIQSPAIATMDKTEIWLIGMNRKRQMPTVKTWLWMYLL